jgi:tetratricopeptide (TPR) repeat protein
MSLTRMNKLFTLVFLLSVISACGGPLGQAGDVLAGGDADGAEALIERYVASDPGAYLANDALEALYLIRVRGTVPETVATFLHGLDALDGGDEAEARERFGDLADDKNLPWAVRGRAAILAARLTSFDEAEEILEDVWDNADDPEVRKAAAVALAALYRGEGMEKDAAELADEFARAFPEGPDLIGAD